MSFDPLADALGITPRSLDEVTASQDAIARQQAAEFDQQNRARNRLSYQEQLKAPSADQMFQRQQAQQAATLEQVRDQQAASQARNAQIIREEDARIQQQRGHNGPAFEQPKPSSAANRPATPRNTPSAPQPRAPISPRNAQPKPAALPTQAPVLPAEPPRPIKPPFPFLGKPPTSLPSPMRFPSAVGPAIAAPVDFGLRLFHGQSPGQAAAGSAGGLVGGIAGGVLGSFAGPVGSFVGSLVGGFVGGGIGDRIYDLTHPPTANIPNFQPPGPLPFTGGQQPGVLYTVYCYYLYDSRKTGQERFEGITNFENRRGPIQGIRFSYTPLAGIGSVEDSGGAYWVLVSNGEENNVAGNVAPPPFSRVYITEIVRTDGQPDTGGNPPASPIPADNRSPPTRSHPLAQPDPRGVVNTAGAAVPGGISDRQGGNPRGDSQTWTPPGVPRPQLSPTNVPQNLGGDFPELGRSPAAPYAPFLVPGSGQSSPFTSGAASGGQSGSSTGGAASGGQSGLVFGGGLYDPIQDQSRNQSQSNSSGQPDSGQLKAEQDPLLPPIPLIPPLVRPNPPPTPLRLVRPDQPPPAPPTPNNTCELPCIQSIGATGTSNSNKLDRLLQGADLAGNAAILAKLEKMDEKLGPLIPKGGLGGFLQNMFQGIGRLADFLGLDRVLNALTFITVMHNAYFLSSSLSQTLFSMVDNVFSLFGIKDSEGESFSVSRALGSAFDAFAKRMLGVETVDGIKEAWKKYSRIYQAASNLLFSIQSVLWSLQSMLEIVGENVNRVGNALRKFGVVGEKAYGWMNEKMTKSGVGGRWTRVGQGLESAENIASNIDSITGEVASVVEVSTDFSRQTKELEDAQKAVEPKKQIENDPVKKTQDESKQASLSVDIPDSALVKPEVD